MNYDSGAVTLAGGTLTMENVLIGHVHGNCFELRGGTANVRRCTFAGAEESRGAQGYGFYHATGGTVAAFTESILSGNVKGGYFVNSASPATFTYCCLQDNGEGLGNFSDDPLFANTKIVVSLYDDAFTSTYSQEFGEKIMQENSGIANITLQNISSDSYQNLMKLVMDYADGIVIENENVASELKEYAKASGKPILERAGFAEENDYLDAYQKFYNEL